MGKLIQYTCRLTGNRRDTGGDTKVLLLDVRDSNLVEFRDHAWVQLNDVVEQLQPKGHQKPINILIEAYQKGYGQSTKTTLTIKSAIKV